MPQIPRLELFAAWLELLWLSCAELSFRYGFLAHLSSSKCGSAQATNILMHCLTSLVVGALHPAGGMVSENMGMYGKIWEGVRRWGLRIIMVNP